MWVMLLVGILAVTTEYRHRTVTTTFLATPRRGAVVAAKLAVAAALAGAYAVLGMVVGLVAALPRLTGAAAIEVADGHVATTVGGAVLGTTLFAVAGVGIGALVRNQTVAVAGALVWFLPAENIVGSVVGWPIARWLPGQAAASATGAGGGTLLPMAAGAALFAGYTAVATVAGTRLAVSRDVT